MLYRLSVQTTGEGIGISNGKWKNHIHLVLKSNSQLLLEGCEDLSKTFGFCEVKNYMTIFFTNFGMTIEIFMKMILKQSANSFIKDTLIC